MRALIISLRFNPGHVSHLVASYKQCEELGYESWFYVSREFLDFLPKETRVLVDKKDKISKIDLAVFLFPSQKNLKLIWRFKRQKVKIVYIFHEPLAPLKEYLSAGFTYKYLIKLWLINRISALTVKWSNILLLPSQKALQLYKNNDLYKNPNYHYLPLMYADEREPHHMLLPRIYFSYIGTVAADHSFTEFLDFVSWALRENWMPRVKFLIATKSDFILPENLHASNRITVEKGRPMKDEVINNFYSSTYVIWNAYTRTTQSGVLAKSFMFGTPAIVLRKNLNEFTRDGIEVIAIDDNTHKIQIAEAVARIISNFEFYSENCRQRFLNSFYYKNYNNRFRDLIQ